MSDDRGRRADDESVRRDPASVLVPLTGSDTASIGASADGSSERPPTDWRRVVRVALAGGVALGLAVATVRSVSDDTDADGPTAVEPASAITTPPTLRPLETLPPPDRDDDPAPDRSLGTAPADTSEPTGPEPVVVPTYASASDVGSGDILEFDLTAAVVRHGDDVPRRSDTRVELGYGGYALDVSIVRDPERDRYRVEFESRGNVEQVVVDVATGTTYIEPGSDDEIRIPTGDVTGDTDVNEFFDDLLLGPVRADTYDRVVTRGRGAVTIDDIGRAREFVTLVSGALVPEWQIYAFGPVGEFPPEHRPEELEYSVYVDEQGRIVQVDGVSMLDRVPQLVRHRLTVLDEPIVVELPGDAMSTGTTVDESG